MTSFATQPLQPFSVRLRADTGRLEPEGPVLTRRLSDLDGLFADTAAWKTAGAEDNPVVYEVVSSPVPEAEGELPQSITTIRPGTCGGEFYMTKGHQHTSLQAEIYLGLSGAGGILLFDGHEHAWIEMTSGTIGYIPPGWAHRSVNTGDEPYRFLAVYPGSAGHDYDWVLRHGMGRRVREIDGGAQLAPYDI